MSGFTTAAAILAGGRARRFGGQDKSRLVVLGQPIIVRQLHILQRVAQRIFVVGSNPGRFADLGLTVHSDRLPNLGAIGGLYTALEVADTDAVIVVACDLPFLHEGVLRELVRRSQSADGTWIRSARGVEPLFACYRRSARHAIPAEIQAGRLKAADLGHVLRMAELTERDLTALGATDAVLANLNSPDDYARVQ